MAQIQTFRFQSNSLDPVVSETSNFSEALSKLDRGSYTVLRLYPENRVLCLNLHMDRLRQSALRFGAPFIFTQSTLRRAIRLAVETSGIQLPRICVLVPFAKSDQMMIMLEDFSPPSSNQYRQGIRVGTIQRQRSQPAIKDSSFIPIRQDIRERNPQFQEILLYDDRGNILEGLTSNFFAVINNYLQTACENILEGISRRILLKVAPDIIQVKFHPAALSDRSTMSEAFLTSTSRGILPVIEIGGVKIAEGKPGPMTDRLRALFDAQVEAELEPL